MSIRIDKTSQLNKANQPAFGNMASRIVESLSEHVRSPEIELPFELLTDAVDIVHSRRPNLEKPGIAIQEVENMFKEGVNSLTEAKDNEFLFAKTQQGLHEDFALLLGEPIPESVNDDFSFLTLQ